MLPETLELLKKLADHKNRAEKTNEQFRLHDFKSGVGYIDGQYYLAREILKMEGFEKEKE